MGCKIIYTKLIVIQLLCMFTVAIYMTIEYSMNADLVRNDRHTIKSYI